MSNNDKVVRIPAEAYEALRALAESDRRSLMQEVAYLILAERDKRAAGETA